MCILPAAGPRQPAHQLRLPRVPSRRAQTRAPSVQPRCPAPASSRVLWSRRCPPPQHRAPRPPVLLAVQHSFTSGGGSLAGVRPAAGTHCVSPRTAPPCTAPRPTFSSSVQLWDLHTVLYTWHREPLTQENSQMSRWILWNEFILEFV